MPVAGEEGSARIFLYLMKNVYFCQFFLPLIDFFSYNKSPPPYFIPFLRIHYAVEGKVILTGS
jgi:hypothetical protein